MKREALFRDYTGEEHISEPKVVSDWDLIKSIATQDERAFAEVYERHLRWSVNGVLPTGIRICRSHANEQEYQLTGEITSE